MTGAIYVKLAFCIEAEIMAWRIFKFIQHLLYRKHRKGHGIHSPYQFEFVQEVIFNIRKVQVPEKVRQVHRVMRKDCSLIPTERVAGFGAGSGAEVGETRTISSFVRKSSVSRKYGALLYRITRWFQPDVILETGTGLGISTIYLSAGYSDTPLHTIEGSAVRARIAEHVIKRSGLNRVSVHGGDLDQELTGLLPSLEGRMVVFLDANHQYEPTIRYTRLLLEKLEEEAVVVMDDIYWSRGMYRAWKEVIAWPEVRVSIDLFHMGILLLRKDLDKTHLKIKF